MWLTPELQVPEDRVLTSRLLHVHHSSCPNRSHSKVRFLLVDDITLARPYHIRAYAITGKNRWVAGILYGIFILQLGVAVYMIIWSSTGPSQYFHSIARMSSSTKGNIPVTQLPQIPLDGYRMCLTRTARSLTVLQMSISLSFGKRPPRLSPQSNH